MQSSPGDPGHEEWWHRVWRAGATSILVVSESESWRNEVVQLLEADGYAVRVDASGDAALEPTCPYDLAVVDMSITGRSPVAVFAALRARTDSPLLAVSTDRHTDPLALEAFAAGADQFAPGVLRPRELVARVRALLRRSPPRPRGPVGTASGAVSSISLDMATRTAAVAGQVLLLSQRESEILYALLERPGRVVTRGQLGGRPRGSRADQSLDSQVRQLRTKLEGAESRRRIVAVRGVGFRLATDAELGLRP